MTLESKILNLLSDFQSRSTSQIARELNLSRTNIDGPLLILTDHHRLLRVKSFKPGSKTNPEFRYKLVS